MSWQSTRTIAVVTGSRAEYGLLEPVVQAITSHQSLSLRLIVTGTHLLPDTNSIEDIRRAFTIDETVPMYEPGANGRAHDAMALGRGIAGLAQQFESVRPDIVLALGDRIEAFAATSAAAISGIRVAHMHGGDRAEGIADESIRHAISKLVHIHLPATSMSSHRLVAMGEEMNRVHIVGSPAVDGLAEMRQLDDAAFTSLGSPRIIVLLHPTGADDVLEHDRAMILFRSVMNAGPTLVMHPNHDSGRDGIMRAIKTAGCRAIAHLPRREFIGLTKRVDLLVGNSSAGLIECAAMGLRCVNVGPRQGGRESAGNVTSVEWGDQVIRDALMHSLKDADAQPRLSVPHPYGDGQTGRRTAELLATLDLQVHGLTKRNTY